MDFSFIFVIIQLVFLEGILSIDNAAVLGAMVSGLAEDQPVPYPAILKFLQPFTDQVLGMQQMAALKVGLLGAYMGRGLMLTMVAFVIANPWLRLLGAIYLIKLAFESLAVSKQPEKDILTESHLSAGAFWLVVLNVELADLAFSIDNVVAAVALSNQLWLVLLGVALGIVMMRFAAGIFAHLIRKEPILEQAAYIVVLNIGIELVLADLYHIHFDPLTKFVISVSTLGLCVLYAHLKFLHFLDPALYWLAEGMGHIGTLVSWGFQPIQALLKLILSPLGRFLSPKPQ